MPIANYDKPQNLINQQLAYSPSTGAPSLNALIIGPQYDLYRYTVPAEAALMKGTQFVYNAVQGGTQIIPYEGLSNNPNYIVDQTFVQVYGEDLEGQLWQTVSANGVVASATTELTGSNDPNYNFEILNLANPNMVRATYKVPTLTFSTSGSAPNIVISNTIAVVWPSTGAPNKGGFSVTNPPSTANGGITVTGGTLASGTNSLVATVNGAGVIIAVTVTTSADYSVAPTAIAITATPIGVNIGSSTAVLQKALASELYGRPVQVGDVLYTTVAGVQTRRIVRSVMAESVAASFGSTSGNSTDSLFYSATTNPTVTTTGLTLSGSTAPTGFGVSTAPAGTQAVATASELTGATVTNGVIVSIPVPATPGTGYDVNNPPSTANGGITIGTGTGAVVTATVSATTGAITGFTVAAGGSGYATTDVLTIATPAVLQIAAVQNYLLVNGCNYAGQLGDRFTLTVTQSGTLSASSPGSPAVLFAIRTASGQYSANNVALTNIGSTTNVLEILPTNMPGYQVTITGTGALNVGQSFAFNLVGAYKPLTLAPDTSAADLYISSGSSFTGPSNTTYAITVITGGSVASGAAVVRVSDTAGIDLTSSVTVVSGTPFLVGSYGLSAQFNTAGTTMNSTSYQKGNLKAGDVFFINAVAVSNSGVPSIFVLNGAAGNTTGWYTATQSFIDIDYRATPFSGLISQQGAPGIWNYFIGTAAQGGVLLLAGMQIFVPGRSSNYQWVTVQNSPYGVLFATWRGLVPAQANTPVQLWNDGTAIAQQFGVADPDNDLGYAAAVALAGSQGKAIYIASVASNDIPGWTQALIQCQRVAGAYAIAPQTIDPALLQLVVSHIEACSTNSAKNWRRGYFPVVNPGTYALLVNDSNGAPLTAKVTAIVAGGPNVQVYAEEGTFLQSGVVPGDYFRINYAASTWEAATDVYGNVLVDSAAPTYTQYTVASVVDDNELILVTGPTTPISVAQTFQLWKADTDLSQVAYVQGVAEAYGNRRVAAVWCDNPTIQTSAGTLQTVHMAYICAEIAGLRTALYPQQGLTNTQILSASNAPLMYTKYTENDLNTAASNGVWIIAQDGPGSVLYIRHQLTTDTAAGLLAWEDSVGTNIDSMCYDIAAIQKPYIGRRNVTNESVDELETDMASYLNTRKEPPFGLVEIGPQLINWTNLTVGIDPNFADRLIDSFVGIVPTPINVITTTFNAATASAASVATVSTSSTTANG